MRTALPSHPSSTDVRPARTVDFHSWPPSIQANLSPQISVLKGFGGSLYPGYGQWNGGDRGPIDIVAIDSDDGTSQVVLPQFMTEQVQVIREFDGALWIPNVDCETGTFNADIATNAGGSWHLVPGPPMLHCFDVQTLDGTDLWLCGNGQGAFPPVVLRAENRINPQWQVVWEHPTDVFIGRIYNLFPDAATGTMRWTSDYDSTKWVYTESTGLVTEDTTSSFTVTDLLTYPTHHIPWGGGIATVTGVRDSTGMIVDNPDAVRPEALYGPALIGSKVNAFDVYYATETTGGVINWTAFLRPDFPIYSTAVSGSYLFIGDDDGRIWRMSLAGLIPGGPA